MTKAQIIATLVNDFDMVEGPLKKMKLADLQTMLENAQATVAAPIFAKVERKQSKRGRKVKEFPGMKAMVENWEKLEVEGTYPLPDFEGKNYHPDLALARHHFKKYATVAKLVPGQDYTIEGHDTYGATITRKK